MAYRPPTRRKKTYSRVKRLLDTDPNAAKKLQRSGKNVAEMFEPNEYVEPVNFNLMPSNRFEHSKSNYAKGFATPTKQKKESNPFGGVGQLPSEAYGRRGRQTRRLLRRRR